MTLHAEKQPGVPRAARALLLAGLLMCCAAEARADCTGPAGAAGSMVYNEADSGMYFCQSTTWVALAGSGPWARSSTNDLYYTAGNVAIGSTTPSTGTGGLLKLDVEGPLGATKFCDKDGNNCFTTGAGAGGVVNGTGTLNYLTKWTGTGSLGNSLLFDNGTNVGIGTATPGALLEVTGAGNKSVLVNWTATAATPSNLAETRNYYAYAYAPMRAANPYGMYISHFAPGGYPGIQGVDTSDAANAFLLQPYGGNVGIGTTSPGRKLDIAGDLRVRQGDTIEWGSNSNRIYSNSTDFFIDTNGINRIYVSSAGNVGIGDTTPDSGTGGQLKLDVEGPVGATKFCDQAGNNCFTATGSGGGVTTGSGTTNYLAKWTGASALGNSLLFDNGTSVGIGTATPPAWAKLEVTGGNLSLIGNDGAGLSTLTSENGGLPLRLKARAGNNPDLVVATNGSVGIGDQTPDGALKLDVEGPVGATQYCDNAGNNCFTTATVGGSVSGGGSGTANYVAKWTSGSAIGNSILYDNGTKVGIGNTSPSGYKLEVSGDVYANGGWLRSSGNAGVYFESWGGGWYMTDGTWIRSYNAKPVYMSNGYDSGAASGVNCGGGLGGGYTFQVCGSELADTMYDRNNAAYYVDPASTSITNDMRAANFYYKDNTAYGFLGASPYADTINTGSAGDPLELNYY